MLGMIAYDATGALPGITVPTLVIVGDKDTTTLPEAGEFIASHVPRAEAVALTRPSPWASWSIMTASTGSSRNSPQVAKRQKR
jgi:pimeloyl-ACP methyl ester carboxylesterase